MAKRYRSAVYSDGGGGQVIAGPVRHQTPPEAQAWLNEQEYPGDARGETVHCADNGIRRTIFITRRLA